MCHSVGFLTNSQLKVILIYIWEGDRERGKNREREEKQEREERKRGERELRERDFYDRFCHSVHM